MKAILLGVVAPFVICQCTQSNSNGAVASKGHRLIDEHPLTTNGHKQVVRRYVICENPLETTTVTEEVN